MKAYLRRFWMLYLLLSALFLAATVLGSHIVTALAEDAPILRQRVIVIDAGHGGEDGGAVSCSGVAESHINLEIALRLDDLMHLLGFETKMIRTTDISVYTEGTSIAAKKVSDLKNRVRIVNETPNALLISIHQNLFADCRYSGAQVFYNAAGEAKSLAEALQSAFVASVNTGSNRKCKRAENIYLMEHAICPAVLVECGFLSNPEEEARLRTAQYQKKLCCVLAATTASYFADGD